MSTGPMSNWSEAMAAMVVSTRANNSWCARRVKSGELVRVFRGAHVRSSFLDEPDRWRRARKVNVVRACAVALVLGPGAVLSHETAAMVHGVPMEGEFLDVHVTIGRRWGGRAHVLPGLVLSGGIEIPPAHLVRHRGDLGTDDIVHAGRASIASQVATAVQCAQWLRPRRGVVVVSGLLRLLSRFDRFDLEESRRRERRWRTRVAARLNACPPRTRNIRRARAVIAAADAGCESVAEAGLVWALKAAGFSGVRTQVRHRVGTNTYFVDVEIGNANVATEFDGKVKYGETPDEVRAALSRQHRRQKDLESLGLVVLRFEYRDLSNWEAIRDEVCARAPRLRRPRPNRFLIP